MFFHMCLADCMMIEMSSTSKYLKEGCVVVFGYWNSLSFELSRFTQWDALSN